ncbi:MAG: hypothetical protein LCH61_11800 [Proteobacteria bacterium]|nr:hypothetical protein [Pseudomonadota bacterium]
MPYQRVLLQLSIFLAIVLAGLAALLTAEAACATWLPGDTLWTLRHVIETVLARIAGTAPEGGAFCTAGGGVATVLDAAGWYLPVLGGVLLAQGLYEWWRHDLLRAFLVWRGRHALVLGDGADLAPLAGPLRKAGSLLLVGRDRRGLEDIRRGFWRLSSCTADGPPARFGAGRARSILAVSRSDVANLNFVERLKLANADLPPVTLRIENAAIRAAQRTGGTGIEEISLDQTMFRTGARLGDPGRLFAAGAYPAHIVFVGAGPRLGELALHLAAFGYGLERAMPRFSIVSTAGAGTLPVVERLRAAGGVADLRFASIDRADAVALERTLATLIADTDAIAAIHCIDQSPGEALASALVAAATLALLKPAHAPPVIAYASAGEDVPDAAIDAGVIVVAAENLATVIAENDRRDRVARAVHEAYLAHQQAQATGEFGTAPAERPWDALAMAFRDDNRAVADHIDHMLMASGLTRRPSTAAPVMLDADQIERMSAMAHARWMAGRLLGGWRYGPERSEPLRLHPSLVPYDALSDVEKDKDRQQIRAIPHILAILGEEIGQAHQAIGEST